MDARVRLLIERRGLRRGQDGLSDQGLVTVRMPGGTLAVEVGPDWSIRLQGPVEEVYSGRLSQEFMNTLNF